MILVVFAVMTLAVIFGIYLCAGLIRLSLKMRGRVPTRLWRRTHRTVLIASPILFMVLGPAVIGLYGSRGIGTRRDERAYAGPRLDAAGAWVIQDKRDLQPDAEPSPFTVKLASSDGILLRGFHVPARGDSKFIAVLVHGLFRGGLELERVASMLRELGADVLILEMRNHGGSGRALATYGRDESRDVVAAVKWLRAKVPGKPLMIFGVSLGTAAVSLALPQIDDISAVVLDSPLADLSTAADRNLNLVAKPGRRALSIPQPWRATLIASLEFWSGFSMTEVKPTEVLKGIPETIFALVVGGEDDLKMPPDVVRAVYEALPCLHKELWLRTGSDHGRVWIDDPLGYEARLARIVQGMLAD